VTTIPVLGVDPALRRTGLCLVEPATDGLFRLLASAAVEPTGKGRGDRLLSLQVQFRELLRRWQPGTVYIEKSSFWWTRGRSNLVSLQALEAARVVMLVATAECDIPAAELSLASVRTRLLGRANAPVAGLMPVLRSLGIDVPRKTRGAYDDDIASAAAVAIFGLMQEGSKLGARD
jgi:Holliday junction resolvasome RuvABC endonuclease subunit